MLVVALALGVVAWWFLRRQDELFALRVDDDGVHLQRGRIPPSLLDDIRDALRLSPDARGTVRVVFESARPRVVTSGVFDDGAIQRLRNVVGRYPLQRIRSGSLRR